MKHLVWLPLALLILTACATPATAIPPQPTTAPGAPNPQVTATPMPTPTAVPQPTINSANEAIALAQLQFPKLKDIKQTPRGTIGASTQITVKEQADGWQLIFWQGEGDCMAGCINHHFWYVAVSKSGLASLAGEYMREYDGGSNAFKTNGQPMWGVPQ